MRLIVADAFKEYIRESFEDAKGEFQTEKYLKIADSVTEGFLKDIDEQPTVEAKPVVYGEWIDTQPDYHPGYRNNAYKCSVCGDYYTTEPEDLFFCPRCGADMRKKVE